MEQGDRMDLVDPDNLHLSVEINRRIPIVRQQREDSTDMPNYGGRRSNSRSLYGWAPGSDDEETDVRGRDESDDDQIQPFLHAISDSSTSPTRPRRHETADGRARSNLADEPSTEARSRFRHSPISTMEALLQSARRQPRLLRTRTLENYLLDRYAIRANEEVEETERSGGSSSARAYRYRPQTRGDSHRVLTHSDLLARATAHRQMHSNNTSGDSLLKDAIIYLDRLRHSNSFEESISSAAATAFVALENFSWKDDDFILDTHSITPPAACSWLRPGMVFSGCQRAANARCAVLSQRASSPHAPGDPVIVNGNDSTRINVYTTTGRQYLANTRDENWPVKVTLHNINYSDMTLSGTMEAYNIPDKTSPTHDAHIITFLEGEIIDFNRHTLETKNFTADADIDSTYWRELEPFKDLSDSEMAKNLVSKKWISEDLAEGWILMRWKGKCIFPSTPFCPFPYICRCANMEMK